MAIKDFENLKNIIKILSESACTENVSMNIDKNNDVVVFFYINDVFEWACSETETIEVEDIELLQQTYNELSNINIYQTAWLPELFSARKRKTRPQGAWLKNFIEYKGSDKIQKYYLKVLELFEQAGPERSCDFFNPINDYRNIEGENDE